MARSGEHYMPRPDGNFTAWAGQFVGAVTEFYEDQGLDHELLKPLQDALEVWNTDYAAHVAAQQQAQGARRAKDAARAALEAQVRPVANFVQSWRGTTDADRAALGITVRPAKGTPAPTPVTRPLALVESGQRLLHQLRLVDEATPTRRARPRGVLGAEVWVKLVDPPTADAPAGATPGASVGDPARDPSSFTFLTMTTRPSFRAEFKADQGGKTAAYMARWVNTRGEKGPWSEVTTATVAA